MRVGIIAPPWVPIPPSAYGGTEEFVDELACGLVRAGHDVTLFCTGDSRCPVERRWVFEASQPDSIGNDELEQVHVEHAYAALREADVVHDNTVAGPLHARNVSDLPVVVTHHGPFDATALDNYRATSDRVELVAISHHQASTARGVQVGAVIHHGVDPERFPVGRGDGGYFLFLNRMTSDKGAHRAAAFARETGINLVLAGKKREPAEHAYFNEHVEPLLGSNVEYVGEVDADEKLALLGSATALLNPIQWPEPFGLVMIEAMACGTPVVATACGAAPEIVRDGTTGLLCEDEREMAARLGELEGLDRRACRTTVEQHFSTERMVRDYAALFERVARREDAA